VGLTTALTLSSKPIALKDQCALRALYLAERVAQFLAPLYGWFTEEFNTADWQEAKTLFNALQKQTRREMSSTI
jgi:hypothetical protein